MVSEEKSKREKREYKCLNVSRVCKKCNNERQQRNYWKYLKDKFKKEGNELGSITTTQLKLLVNVAKLLVARRHFLSS